LKNAAIIPISFFIIVLFPIGIIISAQIDLSIGDLDRIGSNSHFKVTQWTPHSPIYVHGITNLTQTAEAENWSGDGTRANPYIIEGYNISSSGDLIVIQDTPLYFTIRDCFLNETTRLGRGIIISGSSNGIIEDNMLFGSYYGIELINSNYTTITRNEITNQSIGIVLNSSHHNQILQNVKANNLNYGISLLDGSSFNTVAWNLYVLNGGGSSQAYDSGINNIFVFNHWNTLTTPDNNGDEIVDVPYLLDGSVNNRDSYPLTQISFPGPLPDIHEMLEPKVLYPNGGEINTTGILTLQWLKAFDCKDHLITYDLNYSLDDETTWIPIISGLEQTYFEWDVSSIDNNSSCIIRLTAVCSEGYNKSDVTDSSFNIKIVSFTTTSSSNTPVITETTETTTTQNSNLINLQNITTLSIIIAISLVSIILVNRYRKSSSIGSKYESLHDINRNRAVSIKTLTQELDCSRLNLPEKIKQELNVTDQSLVLRSEMMILEDNPPTDSMCQICTGKLEGESYLQCKSCLRYVCLLHYVDLKNLGEENCPNCDEPLSIFPFTCEGCKLDYNQIVDVEGDSARCKLCGYSLPSQSQLIYDRTRNITSSADKRLTNDEYNDKDKS
jgi:parallel beta-helix repeat protein